MNNVKVFFKEFWQYFRHGFNSSSEFFYVNVLCLIIAVIGFLVALTIFLATGINGGAFGLDFCVKNECMVRFSEKFSSVVSIVKVTGGIILGIFAFGSFGVACKNYVNSKNAFNSNIHVSNVSVFLSYLESEITKRDKLKRLSFDALKWYNLIFSQSKDGVLEVSDDYVKKLREISSIIHSSNSLYYSASEREFSYKKHQTKLIGALFSMGITLHRMPRLDFYEVEGQIFDLIEVVNSSFCYLGENTGSVPKREYR